MTGNNEIIFVEAQHLPHIYQVNIDSESGIPTLIHPVKSQRNACWLTSVRRAFHYYHFG
jgi:hypothetical protein